MKLGKNRVLLALVAVVLIAVTTAGCSDELSQTLAKSSSDIAGNQQRLEQVVPTPTLDYSNERANIAKRALTFGSDPNKVSWIYLLADNGVIVGYFSVKGKVSNLSSYLVPDEQVIHDSNGPVVVQAPDIDGSYGTNGDGVFWYDTQNIYHEWNGLYFLTDQPVKLSQQPVLVQEDSGN